MEFTWARAILSLGTLSPYPAASLSAGCGQPPARARPEPEVAHPAAGDVGQIVLQPGCARRFGLA